MKKHLLTKQTLALSLALALALGTTACGSNGTANNTTSQSGSTAPSSAVEASISESSIPDTATASVENEIPMKTFTFTVVDGEGNETVFDIESDKETVGEALLEQGLIEGEEGQYGLYVKTVNGIIADYETTGTYWAFYINGEYGTTGVDMTPITEGENYSFKVE
ncbi:MAG: DUF4430 domain-containing protein [Lachnospiraceae bacterium]|nr:DUF4430 domain-containing protein [Lachnospiraceae bacterium]